MNNARLRTKAGGHFYMQNENRTAAKDCPVSGEDLFFAHPGAEDRRLSVLFAVLHGCNAAFVFELPHEM